MEQDFFTNIPSEITIDILSRLPLRAINAICKCVSKPWLHLLNSDDFVKCYLSRTKPSPALAVLNSTRCTVFELEDEEGVDLDSHGRHYNPLINFDFPHGVSSMEVTAADGFLLLFSEPETLYVCNPLTRDYVELSSPEKSIPQNWLTYGFGVSKIGRQHKVVCINSVESDCRIYTLETGTWRGIDASALFGYGFYDFPQFGKFVNGNLHWIVLDSDNTRGICCFDVETECFSIFARRFDRGDLSVLRDCLCVCYTTPDYKYVVIWSMKEYGVEESWRREYVIHFDSDFERGSRYVAVYPIKVFKDGDILMLWDEKLLIYYSKKTKTTQQVGMFDAAGGNNRIHAMILTPTLFSLKTFGMGNGISF